MKHISEKQFGRLKDSIKWSLRQLEYPRKKRVEAVKQYVGFNYSDSGADRKVPVNMLALAVQIYVRQLAARAPRALVSTKMPEYKPTAASLELAINQIPEEIGLADTLRKMVMEALFSLGVVKVGLHTIGTALGHSYGGPFVDIVTLDDYFCDMAARDFSLIDYEGNDYWLDYDEVMESDLFEKSEKRDLKPDQYTVIGAAGESRAEAISNDSQPKVFKDKIWLRDVWLPSDGLLVTYSVKNEKLLRTVPWDGPSNGPYHKLGFSHVPGNLLPLPPASLWLDLHELANTLFRKLGDQADSQKTVLGFTGGNEDSVGYFKSASDGDGIVYTGAEPKMLTAGGVDPKTLAFYLQCRDLFSYFGGNLDVLGGLAPQAQTLGQDKLLSEAASSQLRDMASKTTEVVAGIFRVLSWYEWSDPIKRRTLEKPIPGAGMSITVPWSREQKRGNFSLYDLSIDVYSLQDDSPGIRLQKLGLIMQQYIIPLAPMIQAAGGIVDVQTIMEMVARYSDFEELAEIVKFVDQQPQQNTTGKSAMPANTSREYVRTGRPGMTREGSSRAMQNLLIGGNAMGSEMGGQ